VTLEHAYRKAVRHRVTMTGSPEVSPSVLSEACVDVLPTVEGAGISLAQRSLRVPLGWSSPTVGIAERAQTTLGSGPCIAAMHAGAARSADAAWMAQWWPVYWDELFRLTPYRSVVSLPLRRAEDPPFGALDLYSTGDDLASTLSLPDLEHAVADPISAVLSGAFAALYDADADVPAWIGDDPAVDRTTVWTAVGMLIAVSTQSDVDALATLRGWAYRHGRDLDEVAISLVERETTVATVLAG
jgi:hypothetical protein